MPRIDPHQLLNCLQVLLSPNGGILSKNEVQRLANLMTKFSKKLVSKCIYVLILSNTERPLLDAFMGEGGWNLLHLWLQDAHLNSNWALVKEILDLLLLTPVDVERLKMNNLPKLVKNLTKRDDLADIQQLSVSLVEEWLTMVKDVTKHEQQVQFIASASHHLQAENAGMLEIHVDACNDDANGAPVDTSLRLKFVRDGRQVISRVVSVNGPADPGDDASSTDVPCIDTAAESPPAHEETAENSDMKSKCVPKKSSSNDSSSNARSRTRSSSKDSDRTSDKDKKKSSSRSSSSSSTSRDKERSDRRDRHKERHKSNGAASSASTKHKSSSSSARSSSKSKEDQAEKDKDTLAKIQPHSLQKSGRIPKRTDDGAKSPTSGDKKEAKKSSFSVVVRRSSEEKPKTVKVYNSKMRSTGLMEEARPAPPRSASKKSATSAIIPANLPVKRASPIREPIPPPEKRSRLMDADKGGIKLIPAKHKPAVLQESDIFMDALAASATTKKEPKKRKRRLSVSKDGSPPGSPSTAKQPTSPSILKNISPANFYQDTLVTDAEDKSKEDADGETPQSPSEDGTHDAEDVAAANAHTEAKGLKGVLSHGKRKGPKRSIRWRPDDELVEVQYFELDETERVNVMKPFMDMQRMEMSSEREALRMRKLPNEDVMDAQIPWRTPIELDAPNVPAEVGSRSLEKNIQFAREKQVLQAIYFNNRVPDAPAEPDPEVHATVNPIVIPLDDPDHPDSDVLAQPWPEPKSSPPHMNNAPAQSMFNNTPPAFLKPAGNPFAPPNMGGFAPNFVLNRPPNMPTGDWNMLPNGLPGPNMMQPDLMQQGPPMFDNYGPGMGMVEGGGFAPFNNAPNSMQQMQFGPNNFNMRGRGGFRRGGGPIPGPNNGPWLRMGAPNNQQSGGWNNQRPRGFCHSFKKNGYCRNRDNCPYIH